MCRQKFSILFWSPTYDISAHPDPLPHLIFPKPFFCKFDPHTPDSFSSETVKHALNSLHHTFVGQTPCFQTYCSVFIAKSAGFSSMSVLLHSFCGYTLSFPTPDYIRMFDLVTCHTLSAVFSPHKHMRMSLLTVN